MNNKNIFIVGIPRSGKSTLSRLIKEKYPNYNQFSFEAIRNGFIDSQPELGMENRNSEARKNILPKHLISFAHWNSEILSNPSLIEGSFCSIEELYNLKNDNDYIICLGLGTRTLDEIINGIKENDKDEDYTKNWSEEKIRNHFYNIVEEDKYNYDFCVNNNIEYYDTYLNREEVFNKIINNIKGDING